MGGVNNPWDKNVVELAQSVTELSELVKAVVGAGLDTTLSTAGPITVFAPNDAAFGKLAEGTMTELMKAENKADLTGLLQYHVINGKVLSTDLAASQTPATLTGKTLLVTKKDGKVMVNGRAEVKTADQESSNGVVHIIDTVLTADPNIVQLAQRVPQLSTLVTAVLAADLATTLSGTGPFTVFAPNDDAFGKLAEGTLTDLLKTENKAKLVELLQHHVITGKVMSSALEASQTPETLLTGKTLDVKKSASGVTVNSAKVSLADQEASNGVAHIIDTVLTVPVTVPESSTSSKPADSTTKITSGAFAIMPGMICAVVILVL